MDMTDVVVRLEAIAKQQQVDSQRLTRIEASLETTDKRGCSAGEDRMRKLERKLDTENEKLHNRLNNHRYLTYIVGAIAGSVAAAARWVK